MKTNIFTNFLNWVIVLGIAGYVFFTQFDLQGCNKTTTFKIGRIDPQFNLDRNEAIRYATESANLWNDGLNRNVLAYDPNGKVEIMFVYDERQRKTIQNNILKEQAAQETSKLNRKETQIQISKVNFENQKQAYEQSVKNFEESLNKYNSKVEQINYSGGATREQSILLAEERSEIEHSRQTLESKRQEINNYLESINSTVDSYNSGIQKVNTVINKINQNNLGEFEQGTYQDKKITLYEYQDTTTLKRLISHELGHALGLDHTSNTDSIMHYINKSDQFSLHQDDIKEYNRICNFNI